MAVSAAAADYDWANTQIEFNLNARQLELLIADGKMITTYLLMAN